MLFCDCRCSSQRRPNAALGRVPRFRNDGRVDDCAAEAKLWVLEGTNPNSIQVAGVSKDDVQPGDRISVRCHPLRDGSEGCVLGFVTPIHGDLARGHGVETAWN